MNRFAATILCTALITSIPAANAKDCRETDSVVNSAASVQGNLDAGGHVFKHIPNEQTEANETLFASWDDFASAFKKWADGSVNKPAAKGCGGKNGSVTDCVAAKDVGITTAATCVTLKKDGTCDKTKPISPQKVTFNYVNKPGKPNKNGTGGTNGIWVLRTAWPTANSECK
jgi:hypothetical protein